MLIFILEYQSLLLEGFNEIISNQWPFIIRIHSEVARNTKYINLHHHSPPSQTRSLAHFYMQSKILMKCKYFLILIYLILKIYYRNLQIDKIKINYINTYIIKINKLRESLTHMFWPVLSGWRLWEDWHLDLSSQQYVTLSVQWLELIW